MKISALLVQFPVTLSVKDNLAAITNALKQAIPGDLVICPEGCLSGYERDTAFLDVINQQAVADALQKLEKQVMEASVHLWLGACVSRDGTSYAMRSTRLFPRDIEVTRIFPLTSRRINNSLKSLKPKSSYSSVRAS